MCPQYAFCFNKSCQVNSNRVHHEVPYPALHYRLSKEHDLGTVTTCIKPSSIKRNVMNSISYNVCFHQAWGLDIQFWLLRHVAELKYDMVLVRA
jgi:hypothetical protein